MKTELNTLNHERELQLLCIATRSLAEIKTKPAWANELLRRLLVSNFAHVEQNGAPESAVSGAPQPSTAPTETKRS
jgi:hypothetical protein